MGKITIEIAYNSVVASFWQGQKGVFNDKVLAINKMPPFFLYPFSTPSTFYVASSWHKYTQEKEKIQQNRQKM